MEKLLTVKELCDLLQVSQALVYKGVNYCFISHIKLGAGIGFKETQVDAWIKRRERKGRSAYMPRMEGKL